MGLVAFLRDQLEMWAGDPEDGGDADNAAYYAALLAEAEAECDKLATNAAREGQP